MSKSLQQQKALKLRKAGRSIKSIASHLNVSKSSVSLWCRNIVLTKDQKKKLFLAAVAKGHKGRVIGAATNKCKRLNNIFSYGIQGRSMIEQLSSRDLLVAGAALYWAEGSKKDNKLSLVNSDPKMIVFMYKWFKDVMGVKIEDFMPRIFINEMHKPRINKVLNFWSFLLQLPVEQFGRPVFLKAVQRKKYDNYESYYGVLALRIRRGTLLKYKILGLIEKLGEMSV